MHLELSCYTWIPLPWLFDPILWSSEMPCHPYAKKLLLLSLLVTSRLDSVIGAYRWFIFWLYQANYAPDICKGGGGGGKKAEGKAQIHWLKQTSVTSSAEYWWCQLRLPKLNWSPLGLEASVHGVAFRPLLSFKESSRWHRFSQESGFHLTSLVVFLMM